MHKNNSANLIRTKTTRPTIGAVVSTLSRQPVLPQGKAVLNADNQPRIVANHIGNSFQRKA